MRKAAKGWIIAATVLTVAGALMVTGTLAAVGFDVTKLGTVAYSAVTEEISADFDNIAINVRTADIKFIAAEDAKCTLLFYQPEKEPFAAEVQNKTLVIRANDKREWVDHFGLTFEKAKMTVALPKKAYDALTVESVTGDISIPKNCYFHSIHINSVTANVSCAANVRDAVAVRVVTGDVRLDNIAAQQDIDVAATTGDLTLSGISGKNMKLAATTGDVALSNVTAQGKLGVSLTTGDIRLEGCDANEIQMHTVTGNVTGTLLTGKTFRTETVTGNINVPPSAAGGTCDVSIVTGNIDLTIK